MESSSPFTSLVCPLCNPLHAGTGPLFWLVTGSDFLKNGTGSCLVSKGLPKGCIKRNRGHAEMLSNKTKYSSLDSYIIVTRLKVRFTMVKIKCKESTSKEN